MLRVVRVPGTPTAVPHAHPGLATQDPLWVLPANRRVARRAEDDYVRPRCREAEARHKNRHAQRELQVSCVHGVSPRASRPMLRSADRAQRARVSAPADEWNPESTWKSSVCHGGGRRRRRVLRRTVAMGHEDLHPWPQPGAFPGPGIRPDFVADRQTGAKQLFSCLGTTGLLIMITYEVLLRFSLGLALAQSLLRRVHVCPDELT
jgi:hypothetical protein